MGCFGSSPAIPSISMDFCDSWQFGEILAKSVILHFWVMSYALSQTPKTNQSSTTRWAFVDLRGPLWAFVQSLITSVDLRGIPPAFSKPSWLIFGLVQGNFCLQQIFFQAEPESCRTVSGCLWGAGKILQDHQSAPKCLKYPHFSTTGLKRQRRSQSA